MASRRYGRYLSADWRGRPQLDAAKVKAAEKFDGKFVVITNDDTLSAEDVALAYKAGAIIEGCFRRMKQTGLQVRPMFHWTPRRIEAHVKLCVLVLQMQRTAELRTGLPWARLAQSLDRMRHHHRVTVRNVDHEQIRAGTIRGYVVTTATRVASLPDLPTAAEAPRASARADDTVPAAPRGKAPAGYEQSVLGFVDGTNAFTKSGTIRFNRPPDLAAGEVTGEPNFWIRVRIELGDYGIPGAYMLDGDKWVWRDERPLRPPAFKSIGIRYRTELDHLKYFVSYNDFRYRDHSEEEKNEYRPFQPFQAIPDEGAALYLGWTAKLPNEQVSFYLQFVDAGSAPMDYAHAEHLAAYYAKRDALWEPEQRVIWEYYNGKAWTPLVINDGTKNFTESGFIDFVGPDDMEKTLKFTEDRFWLRARLEMGGYIKPPRVRRVLQNTVEAANVRTIYNEILGSSDGTPLQSYTLLHGPLLDGQIIEVREREEPLPEDIEDLGESPVRLADDREGGYMVRWKEVESFFESGPKSRHYVRDPLTRQISFGDGLRGMIPPQARNSIIAREYRVGGGSRGNVNAYTLTSLTRAVPYIEKVYNVLPAVGGADAETVDQAKERAPLQIKSRDRAVTAEDFETLALRSTTSVARAKALPSDETSGHVQLVIVPVVQVEHSC